MFRKHLLAGGALAFSLGPVAFGHADGGKPDLAQSGPCCLTDRTEWGTGVSARSASAQRYVTVHGRLVASNRGEIVESRRVAIRAANEAQVHQALACEKADFAESLAQRGKRSDRIDFVPERIEGPIPFHQHGA